MSELQDVLFSALVTSVCYWTTIFLLAIVGAYLIHWWLTHPGPYAAPANDPWGITTPPWLILPLAPIGVVGSLGHAVWCALRGQRTWKMLITAATPGRRHGLQQVARNLSRADVERPQAARSMGRA